MSVLAHPIKTLLITILASCIFAFGCTNTDSAPVTVVDGDLDQDMIEQPESDVEPDSELETDEDAELADPPHFTFWWEETDLTQLEANFDMATEHNLEVTIGLHKGEVDFDILKTFLISAASHNVKINIWPLLEMDEGYFPNVRNVDTFKLWWDEIVQFILDNQLTVNALVIDLEPPIQVLLDIQGMFASGDIGGVKGFLVDRYNKEVYETGKQVFIDILADAHEKGFAVHASTLFLILDDFADEDDDIQRGFDCPIDGLDWDRLSFQLYRSAFSDYLGGGSDSEDALTSHIVYDYGKTAIERYPDIAALDLGIIGAENYSPEKLQEDIQASYGAGFSKSDLNIYALHIMLRQDNPLSWMNIETLEATTPEEDLNTTLMRSFIQALDKSITLE